MKPNATWIAFLLLCVIATLFSCNRETQYQGDTPKIAISLDTLTYDTVFTARGSATKSFKIYNLENEDILVDVALNKGDQSMFRLNVDGTSDNNVTGVRIAAKDSIYIFADVTVDPDAPISVSPFVIEETLSVKAGQTADDVLMVAWGQNANYIPSTTSTKSAIAQLSCNGEKVVWEDEKPYVIYGILVIDDCTLEIAKGRQIYVHGGIVTSEDIGTYQAGWIYVQKNGSIQIQGTPEEPVVIQGDRLEDAYQNVSGQWVGIYLGAESKNNVFKSTEIKNAYLGVRADSASQFVLDKCKLYNLSTAGIAAAHAQGELRNSLIYRTGANACQLVYGGDYKIINSTFDNYSNSAAVYVNNYNCYVPTDCENTTRYNTLDIKIENSVMVGNKNELIIDLGENPMDYQGQFSNNYIDLDTTEERLNAIWKQQENSLLAKNTDTLFFNKALGDYSPDTMSILINRGLNNGLMDDINGTSRDEMPDIGCYEFF